MNKESMSNSEIAKIFKAFSDVRRVEILKLLVQGEKCACKILEEFEITQPTLSHHMKILCDAGIVMARKDGKWTHYSIDEKGTNLAKDLLYSLTEIKNTNKSKNSCCK